MRSMSQRLRRFSRPISEPMRMAARPMPLKDAHHRKDAANWGHADTVAVRHIFPVLDPQPEEDARYLEGDQANKDANGRYRGSRQHPPAGDAYNVDRQHDRAGNENGQHVTPASVYRFASGAAPKGSAINAYSRPVGVVRALRTVGATVLAVGIVDAVRAIGAAITTIRIGDAVRIIRVGVHVAVVAALTVKQLGLFELLP